MRNMRKIVFMGYMASMVLMAGVMGCESQNPICNDQWCVDGRIFSRAEIGDAEFDEVDVNTTNLFTLIGDMPPAETENTTPSVDLARIVADVNGNGIGSEYKGQTVTITAVAWINYSHVATVNIKGIGLYTHNSKVSCIVQDADGVNDLESVDTGSTYTLTISITEIHQNATAPDKMTIYANLVTPPEKEDVAIQDVTIAEIVTDVANGGTGYLKSTIRVNATVLIDTVGLKNNQGLVLQTDNDKVVFFLIDPDSTDDLTQYNTNSTYAYVLYVGSITEDTDGFTVTASVLLN